MLMAIRAFDCTKLSRSHFLRTSTSSTLFTTIPTTFTRSLHAMSKPSILNIGVVVDHPLVMANYPPNLPSPQELRVAIEETIVKMKELGYKDYQSVEINPDTHIAQVTSLLKEQHW